MKSAAIRQFNKVLEVCPVCRSGKPKELVENTATTFNATAYWIVGVCTGFITLLLPGLFRSKGGVQAYCEDCGRSFTPRS